MIDATGVPATDQGLPGRNRSYAGGATTGCQVAQGQCEEMIDPLARYIYSDLCRLGRVPR